MEETKKQKTKIQYLPRMRELLMAGTYTAAQITATIKSEFEGVSEGGVKTVISDSKNVKYTKFKDLVVTVGESGVLVATMKPEENTTPESTDTTNLTETDPTSVEMTPIEVTQAAEIQAA